MTSQLMNPAATATNGIRPSAGQGLGIEVYSCKGNGRPLPVGRLTKSEIDDLTKQLAETGVQDAATGDQLAAVVVPVITGSGALHFQIQAEDYPGQFASQQQGWQQGMQQQRGQSNQQNRQQQG